VHGSAGGGGAASGHPAVLFFGVDRLEPRLYPHQAYCGFVEELLVTADPEHQAFAPGIGLGGLLGGGGASNAAARSRAPAAVRSLSERERFDRARRTGELRQTRWTSRQTLLISGADVDKVNRLASEIPALIGEGVPLVINEPAYTYSKLAEKRVDMLAKATKDARNRAQAIAAQADSSIGAITNAETGTFQLTAPNSTDASNSGSYDTRTIEKDITAVMAVTFRVN
jgi:hypothetical protein